MLQSLLRDLRDIEDYIAQDNPVAAISFVQKLTERFHILLDSPGIGRKCPEIGATMRSSSVGEYLILYRHLKAELKLFVLYTPNAT